MPGKRQPSGGLERTLGLQAALSIGVGTMIGAGIFVFPGLAGGRAGPAAVVSFGAGGLVALLVALCTAELATSMPSSGGAYHFVSRLFGPFPGVLVGVAQCIGLVVAGAFYLVAFARYMALLAAELGMDLRAPASTVALGALLALTGINLKGSRSAGDLQRALVLVLVLGLTLFVAFGALRVAGGLGDPPLGPRAFAPTGVGSIFSTAALVFTSYLGFVQIVTVGGEIRDPQRTLPRALIGSVALVCVLYVLTLYVVTGVLPRERLGELGEAATIAVARRLIGPAGTFLVLGGGLLATLSSANASILSSSRALYALARDRLAPGSLSALGDRSGIPRRALLAVALPAAGLVFLDRLDLLAQVASFLHLMIYGLVCASLWRLRARNGRGDEDVFRLPAARWVAGAGGVVCAGLVVFMDTIALILGGAVLVGAAAWYLVYARGRYRSAPDEG
jgi:amino acid transporter